MDLKEDEIFGGRYHLVEQIGLGGFAEVWKAEDQQVDNTLVAIKVYAPERGMDPRGLDLFRREYAGVLDLQHPHILTARHFDIYKEHPYLILPYCSGGSLSQILMERPQLSEEEIAKVLYQISSALSYLHGKGISHQDIKPGNVLKNGSGDFLLSDFGISERLRTTLRHSVVHNSSMTVSYAPPERFSGTTRPHPNSDVFSLGVVVFEMATGNVPWMGAGGAVVKSDSLKLELPDNYSSDLEGLMNRMLEVEPEDRPDPDTLKSLSQDFLEYGKWQRQSVRRTNKLSRNTEKMPDLDAVASIPSNKHEEKKKPYWLGLLVLLGLIIGGGGYFLNLFQYSDDVESSGKEPTEKMENNGDEQLSDRGMITGENIIIRSAPSIDAKVIGLIQDSGQEVHVLDSRVSPNKEEAILKSNTRISVEGNILEIEEGKALKVLSREGRRSKVELESSELGTISVYLENYLIESIANEEWFKITTKSDNQTGWIFGKFLTLR